MVARVSNWRLLFIAFFLSCYISSATDIGDISEEVKLPNTISASSIKSDIEEGNPINLDNITIIGDLNLTDLKAPVSQMIKITNSRFEGFTNFEGVIFNDQVDLRGSSFEKQASFAKAGFRGDAKLSGVNFRAQADFGDSIFGQMASLISTHFSDDCSFSNTQFEGDAAFLQSIFDKDVDFNFAQFSRLASFWNVDFNNVSFLETQFGGHTTFLNARFHGNATFAATRFNSDVVFRSAQFLKGSTFGLASFAGFADFANVQFYETAFYAVSRFSDNAYFVGAIFDKDLILEGARLYSMELDNITFGKATKINLNGTDYIKFTAHWNAIENNIYFNGAAYLALVKNYKNLNWFEDADDCYFQYRKISQEQEPWGWAKIGDIIAWLSCGYGVRVSYTALWCIITILVFGLILWAGNGMRRFEYTGLEIPGDDSAVKRQRVSFVDALYFSVAMFTTSQAPVNNYPVGFYRHLAMLEGILGWFFLGLFVVVLSGVLIR